MCRLRHWSESWRLARDAAGSKQACVRMSTQLAHAQAKMCMSQTLRDNMCIDLPISHQLIDPAINFKACRQTP